jgi:FkbM family methyltransferase
MINFINKILQKLNIAILSNNSFIRLKAFKNDVNILFNTSDDKLLKLISLKKKNKSQLHQDLFVLLETNFKRGGFFVEFGATNGLTFSNTHLLEKEFGWDGILAEPALIWHQELKKNRSCHIETDCIWSSTAKKIVFNETISPELSTLKNFKNVDHHKRLRKNNNEYMVATISLLDLLKKFNAPKIIDYLSIDTEGSEFEILKSFFTNQTFNIFEFKIITCEHNFTPNRKKIYNLLTSNGYKRKYIGISDFDDWYVKE